MTVLSLRTISSNWDNNDQSTKHNRWAELLWQLNDSVSFHKVAKHGKAKYCFAWGDLNRADCTNSHVRRSSFPTEDYLVFLSWLSQCITLFNPVGNSLQHACKPPTPTITHCFHKLQKQSHRFTPVYHVISLPSSCIRKILGSNFIRPIYKHEWKYR